MIKQILILLYLRSAYFSCKIALFNFFIKAMLIIVKFATLIQNPNAQFAINVKFFFIKKLNIYIF